MSMAEPHDIADNRQLAEAAASWAEQPMLALDTEFFRETTFRPLPGLIQVGAGDEQFLLDPLAIGDWEPLRRLFVEPSLPKVLHACGEDVEIFELVLGQLPQPMLDTQIGAALAGWGFSLSYQTLVRERLGIEVDKEHTRSNWLQRPLSPAQRHYAALDVAHLPALYRALTERLGELGRLGWWREESARSLAAASATVEPEQYYCKLGAGWRLRGDQLVALQSLCAWREREARRRDVPRGRVLKDAQCLEIAQRMPASAAALAAVPELPPARLKEDGATLLALLDAARQAPPEQWPEPLPEPLPREYGAHLKRLRQLATERAAALDMPVELLLRKRDAEALLRSGGRELPPGLDGWRRAVVGDELLALTRQLLG